MTRWTNRPRRNAHRDDGPSLARLVLGLITGIWLFVAAYGVAVLLLAS